MCSLIGTLFFRPDSLSRVIFYALTILYTGGYENLAAVARRGARDRYRGVPCAGDSSNATRRALGGGSARVFESRYSADTVYPHTPDHHPYARALLPRAKCAPGLIGRRDCPRVFDRGFLVGAPLLYSAHARELGLFGVASLKQPFLTSDKI